MLLSELIEELNTVLDTTGDCDVLMHNTETGECQEVASARYYPRTSYHGAVLELDESAVVILNWEWEDEDDSPD
jgi:hypothetical protein